MRSTPSDADEEGCGEGRQTPGPLKCYSGLRDGPRVAPGGGESTVAGLNSRQADGLLECLQTVHSSSDVAAETSRRRYLS